MRRATIAGLLVLLLAGGLAWAAGGSKSPAVNEPEAPADPLAEANEHYNRGLMHRDRAWKLEKKIAAETDEKKRAKSDKKLRNAWRAAQREFESATGKNPNLHQAWGSLGYVLRRQGDFETSLLAYDRALAIEPRYGEAIEYRAEAYLGLGRLEDAKSAWEQLFAGDRRLADQLLAAMKQWVEANADDPNAQAFAAWVAEREGMSEQTRIPAPGGARAGW